MSPARKGTTKSVKGLSAEERAAMKDRAREASGEMKAARRQSAELPGLVRAETARMTMPAAR